ncbi:MAG: hypothetical protein RBS37_09970 [Bacteroidales bacterium]|jgi:hypothetical protein|nr:hypothetical protein [Bacteroidales bacterium]
MHSEVQEEGKKVEPAFARASADEEWGMRYGVWGMGYGILKKVPGIRYQVPGIAG